jgi:hypothetical protein
MKCVTSHGRIPYWLLYVASAPLSTYGASHLSNHRPLVRFKMRLLSWAIIGFRT